MKHLKRTRRAALIVGLALIAAACSSLADITSENLSKAADAFEIAKMMNGARS